MTMTSVQATRPSIRFRQEALGDDGLERVGQLRDDLALLIGGKGVHDSVDCLGRVNGMQRGQNKMARFRRRDCR